MQEKLIDFFIHLLMEPETGQLPCHPHLSGDSVTPADTEVTREKVTGQRAKRNSNGLAGAGDIHQRG